MMQPIPLLFLSLLILVSGILQIRADLRKNQAQVYLFKPLTTALIIILVLLFSPGWADGYSRMILIGLIFSLFGDIFLMLPKDRFMAGLISFLIAHIFYIIAFKSGITPSIMRGAWIPYLVFAILLYARLYAHLGNLKIPVAVYGATLAVMGWLAIEHALTTGNVMHGSAFIGTFLFIVSDSILAMNRFVSPVKAAPAWILGSYYSAQYLIALSTIGQPLLP